MSRFDYTLESNPGEELLLVIKRDDNGATVRLRLIHTFDKGKTWWAFEEISKKFTVLFNFDFSRFGARYDACFPTD